MGDLVVVLDSNSVWQVATVATRRIAVATIVALLVDGSFSRLDNQVAARIGAVVEVERNPAGDSGI